MCNHNFKLSTNMPNAFSYSVNQVNKPNKLPNSPNRTRPLKTPPFPSSNLHPKAHDTHFPLCSPKKVHEKPISSPRLFKRHKDGDTENSEVLQGFAMVKSSSEPQKEFRESMMEMIKENGLVTVKDLEELLECYLCLNSKEYHSVIVEVFEEIWFDISTESVESVGMWNS
ncbi:transcription repressor OFP4-like [Asparagus officinalis]|uniref:transcription repressor OFP4-like n=1 Tax=Asparagus officinalis TaxID=4686 RepID=UPI00098E678B|nr:transcription repressor OFP4-like [Asparagus officinalis]